LNGLISEEGTDVVGELGVVLKRKHVQRRDRSCSISKFTPTASADGTQTVTGEERPRIVARRLSDNAVTLFDVR
jgi:hypothetical protein